MLATFEPCRPYPIPRVPPARRHAERRGRRLPHGVHSPDPVALAGQPHSRASCSTTSRRRSCSARSTVPSWLDGIWRPCRTTTSTRTASPARTRSLHPDEAIASADQRDRRRRAPATSPRSPTATRCGSRWPSPPTTIPIVRRSTPTCSRMATSDQCAALYEALLPRFTETARPPRTIPARCGRTRTRTSPRASTPSTAAW